MVELRQLKYFVKVAQLEHFGRASEELHIVQPALSRQVKQLEEELEVELFERLPRGVKLTAAGRVLLQRAAPLLMEIENMLTVTRLASRGKIGNLRIGFADGATYSGHISQMIGKFRQTNPDVELELIPAGSVAQAELLAQEALDVAFVYWLPPNQSGVKYHEINHEKVMLALANSNKMAAQFAEITSLKLSDLKGLPMVWFKKDNSPAFYEVIQSRCDAAKLVLNVVQEATTESTMLSLVSADIGFTFITETAKGRKPDNVILLDVEDLNVIITMMAMWRANDRSPVLQEFLQVVRQ